MGERLADTVTLVTGSGSGIGTAARRCFAAEGARVLVADLNEASARDGCGNQEVRLGLQIRRTLRGSVASAVEVPVASCGMLDIVCNTAGIGPGGTIEDTSLAHWDRTVAVNLIGTLPGCKCGVKAIMRSSGSSAIANMSSLGSVMAPAGVAACHAPKEGVTTLTTGSHCTAPTSAIQSGARGFLRPTRDTEMVDSIVVAVGDRKALLAGMASHVPTSRVCTADDVANAELFRASDEAAMINGSGLLADGAQLAGLSPDHLPH